MKVQFDFNKGIPSVEGVFPSKKAIPLELKVQGGNHKEQQRALSKYLRAIDYTLKGVMNMPDGTIKKVGLEKNGIGKTVKEEHRVLWGSSVDKSFVVLYTLTGDEFEENMYIADAMVRKDKKTHYKQETNVEPAFLWNLLQVSPEMFKRNALQAISVSTEYGIDYNFAWVGGELVVKSKHTDKLISVDEIETNDEYLFFMLLTRIATKGHHLGVLAINAEGVRPQLLEGMVAIVKAVYGDSFIFLYNCPQDLILERYILEVPLV